MKKTIAVIALLISLALCGCQAGNVSAELDGNTIIFMNELKLTVPDGWTSCVGADAYDELYRFCSDSYDSVEDFREQNNGYYAFSSSGDDSAVMMLTEYGRVNYDENGEKLEQPVDVGEYARSVHDNSIFGYLASGLQTGGDSSFDECSAAGHDAWQSHFEVFAPSEDAEPVFVIGQTEVIFELNGRIISVQVYYFTADKRAEAASVIDSISAA